MIPGGPLRLRLRHEAAVRAAAAAIGRDVAGRRRADAPNPYDGGVGSLRALLDRLDDDAVPVEAVSVHTPVLDDVFFALTGGAVR